MFDSRPLWAGCIACSLLFAAPALHAQDQDPEAPESGESTDSSAPGGGETGEPYGPPSSWASEYMKRLKRSQTIEPLGENPFGESIDLYTGQVTFNHTDIVLEGTGPTIIVSRSRSATGYDPGGGSIMHAFGDWTINTPRIETLIGAMRYVIGTPGENWRIDLASSPIAYQRCTYFWEPWGQSSIPTDDWFRGYDVVLESGAKETLLKRATAYTIKPTMSGVFPAVTLSNLQVTCLPTTKNLAEGDPQGESFLAITPDGTRYAFDWLVGGSYAVVTQPLLGGGQPERQERQLAAMLVTSITDRFGNTLTYNYNGRLLSSITASDGRAVAFGYTGSLITSIKVMPGTADERTWLYAYNGSELATVTLPDLSNWSFALNLTGEGHFEDAYANTCGYRTHANTPTTGGEVSTVTTPSGLTGTFVMQQRWHGRSYTGSTCQYSGTESHESVPPLFSNYSLYERTISGMGVPSKTWRYLYSTAEASTVQDACFVTATCPDTKWVDVVEPDGARTRNTYSTRYDALEGKLIKSEYFRPSGGTPVRTETYTYQQPTGAPYVARLGEAMLGYRVNSLKAENRTPLRERVVTQQDRNFTWKVEATCGSGTTLCFDAFARPTKVTKASAAAP